MGTSLFAFLAIIALWLGLIAPPVGRAERPPAGTSSPPHPGSSTDGARRS